MSKKPTLETIDASLARWKTRLKRAVNTIDKLEKQRKRLTKPRAERASVPAYPTVDSETTLGALPQATVTPEAVPVKPVFEAMGLDDLAIPTFLQRDAGCGEAVTTPWTIDAAVIKQVDDMAADKLRAEQEATKKKKAQGRIAKMKAKKAGDLKKMPLSGKAALDAIKNG